MVNCQQTTISRSLIAFINRLIKRLIFGAHFNPGFVRNFALKLLASRAKNK